MLSFEASLVPCGLLKRGDCAIHASGIESSRPVPPTSEFWSGMPKAVTQGLHLQDSSKGSPDYVRIVNGYDAPRSKPQEREWLKRWLWPDLPSSVGIKISSQMGKPSSCIIELTPAPEASGKAGPFEYLVHKKTLNRCRK